MDRRERLRGLLLGTAVGDALGLPLEGLSPARAARLFPPPARHRLLPGRGLVSDDTEHALFVGQALLAEPSDPARFQRLLAGKLRGWIASVPAGVGFATLRAGLKLWAGVPPDRAGVRSAGNGPAMRSPLIGAFFCNDPGRLASFAAASTRLTHTDPRASRGAFAVARAAAWAVADGTDPAVLVEELRLLPPETEPLWARSIGAIPAALARGEGVPGYAASLGLCRGVTGFVDHTVPVALYAWLRHRGNFAATVEAVLAAGGDTDTVGAIAGALAGATTGEAGIPRPWVDGIVDWPRSTALLCAVADRLAAAAEDGSAPGPVRYPVPLVAVRNLLFLAVVLAHGFRRLAPPY